MHGVREQKHDEAQSPLTLGDLGEMMQVCLRSFDLGDNVSRVPFVMLTQRKKLIQSYRRLQVRQSS